MNKIIIPFALVVIVFFILLPEPDQKKQKQTSQHQFNKNFIITDVNVYDGEDFFENVSVVIEDNKVKEIAKTFLNKDQWPELKASGKTLIPGLIDTHTHAFNTALTEALNFGVTTELDMFTMPEFATAKINSRDQVENTLEADLFSSTILATTKNGHGTEYGFEIPVLNSTNDVDAFIRDRLKDGADYIKAVYNSKKAVRKSYPSISYEILDELISSTHAKDKMLVVHVENLISAKEAIGLGADGIIHSFMDKVVDDEFIQLMQKQKAFIIPTISVNASVAQLPNTDLLLKNQDFEKYLNKQQKLQLNTTFPNYGIPKQAFQRVLDSMALLSKAGINILAGTDAPNPGTTHGASLHGELMFLVQAGLSNEQALHSATGAVRKNFNVGLRGTLKPGALASMVLLNGNPINDIYHTQNIDQIWKNGQLFTRVLQNNASDNQLIEAGLITDFESTIEETSFGKAIIETTDQLSGGKSVVQLIQAQHLNSEGQYLHVKGELIKGFMYLWSGFSLLPALQQTQAVNLSQINSLSFDAKTLQYEKELSLLLFEKGSFQPKEQTITLTDQWQNHKIELTDFQNTDLTEISNISFVVSQTLGEFEFMIDNIRFE